MKIEDGTLTTEYTLKGITVTFITRDFDAVNAFMSVAEEKPMQAEIKAVRQKRSLDANSYFWKLADKVGEKVGLSKEEVYREIIHEVGVFDDVAVADSAVETFIKNWHAKGTGWIAEVQPDCKIKGATKIRCYYGSSTYDTKQMSRLIDRLIVDAKEVGVEYMTPDELERIKSYEQNI